MKPFWWWIQGIFKSWDWVKPCPFCGGKASAMDMGSEPYEHGVSPNDWTVLCETEDCVASQLSGWNGFNTSFADAVEIWNNRA